MTPQPTPLPDDPHAPMPPLLIFTRVRDPRLAGRIGRFLQAAELAYLQRRDARSGQWVFEVDARRHAEAIALFERALHGRPLHRRLSDLQRLIILQAQRGLLRTVAFDCGRSLSHVSRIFGGHRTSAVVSEALDRALLSMKLISAHGEFIPPQQQQPTPA